MIASDGDRARHPYPLYLCRVHYQDPDSDKRLIFPANPRIARASPPFRESCRGASCRPGVRSGRSSPVSKC